MASRRCTPVRLLVGIRGLLRTRLLTRRGVMAMRKPGYGSAYGNLENWYDAIYAPGATQMVHLKKLIEALPFFERVPDQSVILHENGTRYDRDIATRGRDYILVYTFNGHDLTFDLSKIDGTTKDAWWMKPETGQLTYIGNFSENQVRFVPAGRHKIGNDWMLIVTDASKNYFQQEPPTGKI
ncbi:MAG: glycoside hydrolase family 140 protein [Rikenellaceae bacterium]|nr:glycoside hydrolase family 140 protein [Rikenellaceae bacterium]